MKNLKKNFFLTIFLIILIFQINSQVSNALHMNDPKSELVTEELRIKVPSDLKDVWLSVEKSTWEPWLSKKQGFLGRQLFWNEEKEEALILVFWESRYLWKSITMAEVNEIQKIFEENVKTLLNINQNPFKLVYEGELLQQE